MTSKFKKVVAEPSLNSKYFKALYTLEAICSSHIALKLKALRFWTFQIEVT